MIIKGEKGGSDKQRTPVESPDSLVSIANARIVDLVSEGEIFGLVDGDNSVLLNETPGPNFSGFSYEFRTGTQDQKYLAGFPAVENEITVGVELRTDAPYVRAFSDLNLSAVRVTFSVPALLQQNPSNGDTGGYTVEYALDVAEGGGPFVEVKRSAFSGKTTAGYERSERIDLPGNPVGGWTIRVRRLTPNSAKSTIADTTNIKAVTEIIDAKFRYPNSAVIGLSFNAESFGNAIPKRGYHLKGRLIRVPVNYDPETRTYTGIWDGTFKIAYSNNPAWIYYDLLLNTRFGLGNRISAAQVDKWTLYDIARYSDQFVDDGNGGQEPRFTCNLYLQTRADALKVLQDLAGIFRGITYWGAGQALVSADMPTDPVYTYTNGNVRNGKFNYKGSRRSTRYSVALVSWNDPTDMFRAKVEQVQDDALVARLGVKEISLANIGCTSQGQAQRAGRWALLTNRYETETCVFSVGLDGIRARPGQVVRVADNDRAGRRIGGRVKSATASTLQLDGAVAVGEELTCILPTGEAETRTVTAATGMTATVAPAFSAAPVANSIWARESEELVAQLFRIVSISEGGPLEYTITAIKHVPEKYDAADFGTIVSQRPITSIPTSVQDAPTGVTATTNWKIDQYQAVTTMTISWQPALNATRYDVEWRRGEADWVYAGRVATTQLDVVGVYAGSYQIRVKAINSLNIMSLWAYSPALDLLGKTGNPPTITNLATASEVFAIRVTWGVPTGGEDTAFTELEIADSIDGANASPLGQIGYPTLQYLHTGMGAAVTKFFRARLIDKTGNVGEWTDWVYGISSADASEILDYIAGQITETELGQDLLTQIDLISGTGPGSVNDRIDGAVDPIIDQVDALASQVADLSGTPDYEPGVTYNAGDVVKYNGGLYSAKQTTTGNLPTNTTYWLKIGDYASIGDAVTALTVEVDQIDSRVTANKYELEAEITRVDGIASMVYPSYAGSTTDYAGSTQVYAGVFSIQSAYTSQDLALASQIDSVAVTLAQNVAAVQAETIARADADSALASQTTTLFARADDNTAAIISESEARSSADGVLTTQVNSLLVSSNGNAAAITAEATARANADSAMASQISSVQSTANGNTAAIQTTATALTGLDDELSTMYSIKLGIDNQGRYYSAGMGIGIENTPSGMQSQVIFLADRFAIMNQVNGLASIPFVVQGGQTIINSAVIGNATIGFAKINDDVQSTNYVAGVSGWRLRKDGSFEINGSVAGQGRLTMNNRALKVYDASNVLRVQLGDLNA